MTGHSLDHEWRSSRGQIYVQRPNHPNARKDGYVARSKLVMEELEGRFLLPEERVLHIDLNPENDDPDNLLLFDNQQALVHYLVQKKREAAGESERLTLAHYSDRAKAVRQRRQAANAARRAT